MPTYEHECECGYYWEAVYKITEDPPDTCPKCKGHNVKRLISGGYGPGIVLLSGRELSAHIESEGKRIAREAAKDENLRANLIGEEKYHDQQLQKSQLTNELLNIGKDAPTEKQQLEKTKKKGPFKRANIKAQ